MVMRMAMTYSIAPIPTTYNGIQFRSRLEARWALFFDILGIKYEYEPEGFIGCYGSKYLPDFYLPEYDIYVEVKGTKEQLYEDYIKIVDCMDYRSSPIAKGLIILGDIPFPKDFIPQFYYLYWYKGICLGTCLFDIWDNKGRFYRSPRYFKYEDEADDLEIYYGAEGYNLTDTNDELPDADCWSDTGVLQEETKSQIWYYCKKILTPAENDNSGSICSDPYHIWAIYDTVRKYKFY